VPLTIVEVDSQPRELVAAPVRAPPARGRGRAAPSGHMLVITPRQSSFTTVPVAVPVAMVPPCGALKVSWKRSVAS